MKIYKLSMSESCEVGTKVDADKILSEIHDSMCMCANFLKCDSEGVTETVLEAASSLLAGSLWHKSFEDGWINVDPVEES